MPRVVLALSVSLLGACGGSPLPVPEVERPSVLGDKCGLAERESAPLIVDWSSGDRERLEARLREGVLAVQVSDCAIKPLWQCTSEQAYRYLGSTRRNESERIADAQSLYAKLPTTALSLEAKLDAESEIQIAKTTVGRFASARVDLAQSDFEGRCDLATHFVSAVSVGAFRLAVGRRAEAGGSAGVAGVGMGAGAVSERELLAADGNVDACASATEKLTEPPAECGAPIQVELALLTRSLSDAEFREILATGSLAANEACRRHGVLGGGGASIHVVVEPSGHVLAQWDDHPGHFAGTPAYGCVLEAWERLRVEPFAGPPLYGFALMFIDQDPPRDCNAEPGCTDRREHVKNYYRNQRPTPILTKEDAERAKYLGPIPGGQ